MRARFLLLTLWLASFAVMAEEGVSDARRHMIRGIAAIEMAKSSAELTLAANEFRRATELDPNLSAAWYNLGSVQAKLGQFDEAIQSYRRYLELVPNAEDAQKIQDEIIKLEFRQELVGKSKARAGYWVASDGTIFSMKIEGNRMTLATTMHPITDNEVEATYTLVGKLPITQYEQLNYQLELNGNQLSGTWMHSAIKAEECKIPEERGEVTGELLDAENTIVLRHTRTKYLAPTVMAIFPGDYCGGVEAVEKRDVTLTFRGPLPTFAPMGFSYLGLQRSLDTFVKIGWYGRIQVATVEQGSPAHDAGLRVDDEILAIDGIEIKSMTAGEVVWRLLGEAGTTVEFTVLHENAAEPVRLRLQRVAVPAAP